MGVIKEKIKNGLTDLGIKKGDVILMHSSYRSLGDVDGGAKTFFDAFLEVLGEEGTLILPALSYNRVNFENPCFDKEETPGCVGYLPEFFRTSVTGVLRSLHATHSCCAVGKFADEFVKNHEKDTTPVGENSPFTKLPKYNGKILMLGCGTKFNTSMHGVEELADVPYVLDKKNPITYILKDKEMTISVKSYRHDFLAENGEHIRQCYDRITELLTDEEYSRGFVLSAECHLMDAKAVWEKGYNKIKENPLYFVEYPK